MYHTKKDVLENSGKIRFTLLTIGYYHIITHCQVSSVDKFINKNGALVLITAGISPCSNQGSVTWRGADAGMSLFSPVESEKNQKRKKERTAALGFYSVSRRKVE